MHELGIVFYIIKDVKKVAADNRAQHVSKVLLDLGEVSSVIPYQLQDCWRWAVEREALLHGCVLEIHTIPAVTYCENCQQQYPTVTHGKTCPHCGSPNTYLLRGNEVEIRSIEVDDYTSGSDPESAPCKG